MKKEFAKKFKNLLFYAIILSTSAFIFELPQIIYDFNVYNGIILFVNIGLVIILISLAVKLPQIHII